MSKGKNKKVFIYKSHEITASGIILVDKTDKGNRYMVQEMEKSVYYSDFGGKVDMCDKTPFHTAIRELSEETNNIININCIDDVKVIDVFCTPMSKYLVYVCYLPECYIGNDYDYGEIETHTGIRRKVKWIDADEFLSKIHPRLMNRGLIKYLKDDDYNRFGKGIFMFSVDKIK